MHSLRKIFIYSVGGVMILFSFSNAQKGNFSKEVEEKINMQIQSMELQKQSWSKEERKVSGSLRNLVAKIEDDVSNKSNSTSIMNTKPKGLNEQLQINVVVTLLEGTDAETLRVKQKIILVGGTIRLTAKASDGHPVEMYCWIPYNKIIEVAKLDCIGNIRELEGPRRRSGLKLTQGYAQLNADKAIQYFNKNGSGVKVGVISAGVKDINTSINSFDLPPVNNTTHILNAGDPTDNEGTAMMEIIHDMAPSADLYFAGVGANEGPADMANRVNQLRDAGCKIIVDDLGWPHQSPQYSEDLLYYTIQDFLTNPSYNRSYISAAGNDGDQCWTGTMNPNVFDRHLWWYENNQYYDRNYFNLDFDESVEIVLQWADKWNNARSDYDIYLYDGLGTLVGASIDNQGSDGSVPLEKINYTYSDHSHLSPFYIIVKKSSGFNDPSEPNKEMRLLLWTSNNQSLDYLYPNYTTDRPQGQIYGKEMAVTATVGAYPADNENVLESFSSRGPSNLYSFDNNGGQSGIITYNTPAVIGTDGVETNAGAEFNPFYGTSAAAPHVAGIAALYYSKFPSGNFYNSLINSASSFAGKTGGVYYDQIGYGKANAKECLIYSLTSISPGTISLNANWNDVKVNGTVTIAADVVVTVPSGSTVAITGTVNFSNSNSKIVVSTGGTLIIRKNAVVNPSHLSGNVIDENAIIVTQLKEDGSIMTGTTFGRWEGSSFISYSIPKYFYSWNTNETFQANQTILNAQKYNLWKVKGTATSTIANHQSFQVNVSETYTAQFKSTYSGVKIKANLVEVPSVAGTEIFFGDPWLIDFPDASYGNVKRNRGNGAPFKARTSPFYPDYSTPYGADVYQGVFLGQDYNVSNTAFYAVGARLTQEKFLSQSGKNHKFYLQNWSATGANLKYTYVLEPLTWDPLYITGTPVMFTSNSATVNANYKGVQLSGTPTAYRNNSQRKVVKSNGILYNTYESMENVYLEKSTDNGITWDLEKHGKPINTRPAKSPSLYESNGLTLLTYQEQSATSGYTDIKVVRIAYQYGGFYPTTVGSFTVSNPTNLELNPITSFYFDTVVSFPKSESSNSGASDNSVHLRITTGWEQNGNLVLRCGQIFNSSGNFSIAWGTTPYTVNNARHAAASTDGANNIAWEHINSATSSDIYHMQYEVMQTGAGDYYIQPTFTSNLSLNSGYSKNYNPSIISFSYGARVCWIGYRDNIVQQQSSMAKTNKDSGEEYRVVFRDVDPASNRFWHFGNQIASPTITRDDYTTLYVIAWSENNGQYNKFADNSLSTVRTFNTNGYDVQVTNGSSKNYMYAISYNTTSIPYYFTRSNSINSFPKEQSIAVTSGREGVIGKGDASTYFAIGDIMVDGEIVSFVDVDDTINIGSLKTLNSYLVSEPFTITPKSKFFYSVSYGVRDTVKLQKTFSSGEFIKYKVDLVDASTKAVISTFDEVIYDVNNIKAYNNISWEVATEELSRDRTVLLRLVAETNFSPIVSFAEKYSDGSAVSNSFEKQTVQKMSLKPNTLITQYALDQNYPNPFNPVTTISYALPQDGMVTLKIYDALGREVKTLVNEFKTTGRYTADFDASKLSSGVYLYKLVSEKYSAVKKMLLVK